MLTILPQYDLIIDWLFIVGRISNRVMVIFLQNLHILVVDGRVSRVLNWLFHSVLRSKSAITILSSFLERIPSRRRVRISFDFLVVDVLPVSQVIMAKRASTAEVSEVEKKIKKEEPKEETTPSIKDKLLELTKEELVEKYLALSADYESTRAKLKRAEGGEHIARIRYTLKDREHRLMAQDRCNARWKLLGDASALNQRRGLQMEAFVHDTLTSQREEIHGLKRDLDSAKAELNTLRGKAGDEHSKEFERSKKLKEENDKLRVDAKKKAEMEKQLSLSHKANAIYKAKFKEQEKELAERNSRIRQLEEAPRADDEDEEEGEGEEDGEEKEGEAKDGEEAAAAEEDEPEELMLDDGHGEGEETVKADE